MFKKNKNEKKMKSRDILSNKILIDTINRKDRHTLYDLIDLYTDKPIVVFNIDKKTPFYLRKDSFLNTLKTISNKPITYIDAYTIINAEPPESNQDSKKTQLYYMNREYGSLEENLLKIILGNGVQSELVFIECSDLEQEDITELFDIFIKFFNKHITREIASKQPLFVMNGLIKYFVDNTEAEIKSLSSFMVSPTR